MDKHTFCDATFLESKDRSAILRGLEHGLNLDSLNAKVLNKTVTLHLAKILGGFVTSEYVSKMAIKGDIIYTEFN